MTLARVPVVGPITTELGAAWRRKPADRPVSNHFNGTSFQNKLPSSVLTAASMPSLMKAMLTRGPLGKPTAPLPVAAPDLSGPAADLAVTWLGHASALIELDNRRILADPVWSDRISPTQLMGPRRLHPMPIRFQDMPELDAVIISHDHYDHLDYGTVQHLRDLSAAVFLVPLGVDAHLRRWGVPDERIVALDWDESYELGGVSIVCTEARHFSGRGFTRNDTLWSSWALLGPQHRVFFGGDTGYTPVFADIGLKYGPFDLALLPIGAYDDRWSDIHLNPEEALRASADLRAEVVQPIHWATFDLAFHAWVEPIQRFVAAAAESGAKVIIPRPGQRLGDLAELTDDWWSAVGASPAAP